MIKALLFDIGEVLIHTDFASVYERVASRVGVEPNSIRQYYKAHLYDALVGKHDTATLHAFLGITDTPLPVFMDIWKEEIARVWKIDTDMMDMLASLRRTYQVIAVTNLTETRYVADQSIDLYSNFDHALLSFKEGLKKPDRRFYELALSRAGVKPSEAVFIDDQERMVEGARFVGIHGITFVGQEDLILQLEHLGVGVNQ